jgi:hypothetical protein
LCLLHAANLIIGDREIALPSCVAGIGVREALSNRETIRVRFERGRKVALRLLHAAKLFIGDREIALPESIAGVGVREALSNRETIRVRFERGGKVALRSCTPPTLL